MYNIKNVRKKLITQLKLLFKSACWFLPFSHWWYAHPSDLPLGDKIKPWAFLKTNWRESDWLSSILRSYLAAVQCLQWGSPSPLLLRICFETEASTRRQHVPLPKNLWPPPDISCCHQTRVELCHQLPVVSLAFCWLQQNPYLLGYSMLVLFFPHLRDATEVTRVWGRQ